MFAIVSAYIEMKRLLEKPHLLTLSSDLQVSARSVPCLWEAVVMFSCKYLHQSFEHNFPAAYLLQSNSGKHIHVGFTQCVLS